MQGSTQKKAKTNAFCLDKWYLDFTGDHGEAMIFYVARLRWNFISVTYTSWLDRDPSAGTTEKHRFTQVSFPEEDGETITWNDPIFGIRGIWEATCQPLYARIHESAEGILDWNGLQPRSKVRLELKDRVLTGSGYAEKLQMTLPPWYVPISELRWGRFGSANHYIVWIDLGLEIGKRWLWLNGEKLEETVLEDDRIVIPGHELEIRFDRNTVLESERKIASLAEKLLRYFPWIRESMPGRFLFAHEVKWLSTGEVRFQGRTIDSGSAIHELVDFK